MPRCGHAKCDVCSYDIEVVELWDRVAGLYETGRGMVLPVRARWMWCPNCGVSQAEDFPLRAEIQNELWRTRWNFTQWGRGDWQFTRQVTGTVSPVRKIHRQILRAYLDLIATRSSPPRCLNCGNVTFHEFDGDLIAGGVGTLPHIGCAGTLRLELGVLWTGFLDAYPAYSVLGLRIGRFTQHEGRWTLERATEESTNKPIDPSDGSAVFSNQ